MQRAGFALAITLLSGCSWMFTQPPRRHVQTGHVECSESRLAPGWDTYQAAGNGIASLLALSMGSDEMNAGDRELATMVGVTALGLAVLYGVSASYGFRNARECRSLRKAQQPPIQIPGPPGALPGEPLELELVPPGEVEHVEEEEVHIRKRSRTIIRP